MVYEQQSEKFLCMAEKINGSVPDDSRLPAYSFRNSARQFLQV